MFIPKKPIPQKVCPCGKKFPAEPYPTQVYHSRYCKLKAYHRRREDKARKQGIAAGKVNDSHLLEELKALRAQNQSLLEEMERYKRFWDQEHAC